MQRKCAGGPGDLEQKGLYPTVHTVCIFLYVICHSCVSTWVDPPALSQYWVSVWSRREENVPGMSPKRRSLSPLKKKTTNISVETAAEGVKEEMNFLEPRKRSWHHRMAQVAPGKRSQWSVKHQSRTQGGQSLRPKSNLILCYILWAPKALGFLLDFLNVNFIKA